jgi:hypothetical protein
LTGSAEGTLHLQPVVHMTMFADHDDTRCASLSVYRVVVAACTRRCSVNKS